MGQKVNPISFRLVYNKNWYSKWYATKQDFGSFLKVDRMIREFLKKQPCCKGTSKILVRRAGGKIEITVVTARPGLVIGKKGAEIDALKAKLSKLVNQEVSIEVEEVKRPELDAQIVADGIAQQLERRVAFRRAMKRAIEQSMAAGAKGIRIQVSGRVGGAEIARTERYKEGSTPLQTIRSDIDYAMGRAETTYGSLGIKVWVNRGEFFARKET